MYDIALRFFQAFKQFRRRQQLTTRTYEALCMKFSEVKINHVAPPHRLDRWTSIYEIIETERKSGPDAQFLNLDDFIYLPIAYTLYNPDAQSSTEVHLIFK